MINRLQDMKSAGQAQVIPFVFQEEVVDMITYRSKFSPTEKKALELAARYHKGQERIGGREYITHPIEVAELLFHYRFRGKYVFTAFCHDLLEDTDAREEEILETCGRSTLEAVKLLTKRRKDNIETEIDMDAYLAAIRENEVAYPVKVADRTMNLWSARHAGISFREKYLAETEQYYLKFAKDSPLFEELTLAYETIKQETDLEKRSLIRIEVDNIMDDDETSSHVYLEGFRTREDGEDLLMLSCQILREDLQYIWKIKKDRLVTILVSGFPSSEIRRYPSVEIYDVESKDSEGFFEATGVTLASQSILYTPYKDPDSHALLTGVVRGIRGEFAVDSEGNWGDVEGIDEKDATVKVAVGLEVLGSIFTVFIDKDEHPDIKIGEVLSGIFQLFAGLPSEEDL
jgi:hypothetical protein